MPVFKVTMLVTTLVEATDLAQATSRVDGKGLGALAFEMDQGDMIGAIEIQGVRPVAPERVLHELYAVGNDGTFFETEPTQPGLI